MSLLTLVLGVAGALGLAFGLTRRLGSPLAALPVLCVALALARSFPFPVLAALALGAFLFIQRRRSP